MEPILEANVDHNPATETDPHRERQLNEARQAILAGKSPRQVYGRLRVIGFSQPEADECVRSAHLVRARADRRFALMWMLGGFATMVSLAAFTLITHYTTRNAEAYLGLILGSMVLAGAAIRYGAVIWHRIRMPLPRR